MPMPTFPSANPRKPAVSQRCRRASCQPSDVSPEALGGGAHVRFDAQGCEERGADEKAGGVDREDPTRAGCDDDCA
jgi:hypothetical protein